MSSALDVLLTNKDTRYTHASLLNQCVFQLTRFCKIPENAYNFIYIFVT